MNLAVGDGRPASKEELRASIELLEIVNRCSGSEDMMLQVLAFMRSISGCEAVGIRLKKGEDYPFFASEGFSPDFLRDENSLYARDQEGRAVRDSLARPVLECRCGRVISGFPASKEPFFTAAGSFWSNRATELPASATGAARDSCGREGFESVALIPLALGDSRYGLIQLEDRRVNAFCPRLISLYERLAGSVARALAQRLAKEELEESEKRYRSIIRASMDGFRVTDAEGRILDVNAAYCRMSGYSREELLAMRIGDLDAGEGAAEAVERRMSRVMADGYDRYETKHRRADGGVYDVEVSTYFEPERGRSLAFIRDITSRKEASARIESLLKEKEALIKEVQHRVKNNLGTIQSFLSIQAAAAKDASTASVLTEARSRLGSMSLLYEKLNISEDALNLSLREYLPALVRQIAATFPRCPAVHVEAAADDIVLPVRDLTTLGILVNELIMNAMKHAFEEGAEGSLRVRASRSGGGILVSVEDDGKGMGERAAAPEGPGLGLKIVRLLAEQLNACLRIESGTGKGTKVALEFAAGEPVGQSLSSRRA
jgi:PAS domain S-box-containing protein